MLVWRFDWRIARHSSGWHRHPFYHSSLATAKPKMVYIDILVPVYPGSPWNIGCQTSVVTVKLRYNVLQK